MELDENGSTVGQFLRIKIKLDITKPMPMWCPIVYEFLPEFCYVRGIIGHTDKLCTVAEQERGVHQYSKKLRYIPEKKRWDEGALMVAGGGRRGGSWRSGASSSEDKGSGGYKGKLQGPTKSIRYRGGSLGEARARMMIGRKRRCLARQRSLYRHIRGSM